MNPPTDNKPPAPAEKIGAGSLPRRYYTRLNALAREMSHRWGINLAQCRAEVERTDFGLAWERALAARATGSAGQEGAK